MRYCSLKNSPLCLVEMFLDYNSRSRFFQDVRFLQKVRVPIGLSYSSKKRTYERNRLFAKTQRTSFRGHFFGFFYTLLTQRDFFQKQGSVTFLTLCHLTLCKIRKTWWANGKGRTTRRSIGKNRTKFIGNFTLARVWYMRWGASIKNCVAV